MRGRRKVMWEMLGLSISRSSLFGNGPLNWVFPYSNGIYIFFIPARRWPEKMNARGRKARKRKMAKENQPLIVVAGEETIFVLRFYTHTRTHESIACLRRFLDEVVDSCRKQKRSPNHLTIVRSFHFTWTVRQSSSSARNMQH
jgi:hypothetical protein